MRIAVDAHAIGRQLTGNEVYVRSLLRAFPEIDRESEFFAYISGPDSARWIPQRIWVRRVAANPYLRLGWDLGRLIRRDRPDLIHVQYTAPLFVKVPVVVTVHDISFLDHPEFFSPHRHSQLRYTVARTVELAQRVLTVSEFSRKAILRSYDIPSDKVRVVPNAANPDFHAVCRERVIDNARKRLGFADPFIFSVGDLQPRKNQIGLIAAFARLVAAHPQLNHHLVLAGKETGYAQKVREAAHLSGVAERIHLIGFISDDELQALYNTCDCFVFPSFYEGFGLPIVEAMACGRAVACSNTTAMPEVAGSAALLFDPYNTAEIEQAMAAMLLNKELRGRLEGLGIQRAAEFSWATSAHSTLEIYKEAVNEWAARKVTVAPCRVAGAHRPGMD